MRLAAEELGRLNECIEALAEPRRLQVFELILEGQSNRSIGESLAMPPNLVSYHLRVLERAGLVWAQRDDRDERRVYYFARPERLALIVRVFSGFYNAVQPESG